MAGYRRNTGVWESTSSQAPVLKISENREGYYKADREYSVSSFRHPYVRSLSYFTHGARSPTDHLQAWTGFLRNTGVPRGLPRCQTVRDTQPKGRGCPEWNSLPPLLVWPHHGYCCWLDWNRSQQCI